jgi:hypothetical protein
MHPDRIEIPEAGVVLVADARPFAAGPRLGDLLTDGGLAVHQVDPVEGLADIGPGGALDGLAKHYAATVSGAAVVVGHCSAAPLALRIAQLLDFPATVLVRPTWPDRPLIGQILQEVRSGLRATDPTPVPETLSDVDRVLDADLDRLTGAHGIDPAGGPLRELRDRYQRWFGYLFAAADAAPVAWPRGRTVDVLADADTTVPDLAPGTCRHTVIAPPEEEALATRYLAEKLLDRLGQPRR